MKMKISAGNGWMQVVKLDENKNELIHYEKGGKEYSKQEYESQSKIETLQDLVQETTDMSESIGLQVESINDIKSTLGTLTGKAKQMIHDDKGIYFLYDNQHTLNVINELLHRVSNELSDNYDKLMHLQYKLFNELNGED